MEPYPILSTDDWCAVESTVLIGTVYDEIFYDPDLPESSWETIGRNFHSARMEEDVSSHETRTVEELKRRFQDLQAINAPTKGALFYSMYKVWKFRKECTD
eukprot:snap_masked-scaffold_5-processed-gene-1.46-mRNA-1 protein AED:0.26 eAED:1.00 QI:0/-1/0/1/-1/1/1/0/100